MIKNLTYFVLFILFIQPLRAQKAGNGQLIAQAYTRLSHTIPPRKDSLHYYLVNFNHEPGDRKLNVLKRVSYNYYIVSSRDSLTTGGNMLSVAPANSLWKADDGLVQLIQKHPSASKSISIVLKKQNDAVLDFIKTNGTITGTAGNIITVKISLKKLPALLDHPDIIFASPVRQAHTELVINDIDLAANGISALADSYPDINGTNINVSVKEDQYDQSDIDLLGRSFLSVTPSAQISGHATIMSTLIGGNGNSFIRGLGAAPAVKFTSSNFARLLPDTITAFKTYRIGVQNHSYGTGIENFYGIEAVAYDKQVMENDTIIHVFSSGNIGTTTPSTGVYNGVANSANLSGTFKQAKNVIVVGGTGRTDIPEALSSAGPAYDGRVKPDLVADGEDGTSGAAALTTGTVALLQQAYKKQTGRLPSAALIKSILINSADDIGITAVDHKTGYGKLNALEALRTISQNRFNSGSVTNKQATTYQVTVPQNCRELKVSLAWNDVPAVLNAPFALVNDLDLSVTTPGGETLLPWSLSSYPNTDSLLKPAVRHRDSLNNTEQVSLQNPAAGVYTINIAGNKVTTAQQAFYIAYQTRQADQFEWTFPSGNNKIFGAEDNYLRWQNSYTANSGTLSVSYDKGATWAKINEVNLRSDFYVWSPPGSFTPALLKMTVNGTDHISKEFTISKPLTLGVGYTCTTGTLLHWNPQPGATGYVIYNIKDNVLQKLSTATDTMAIIPAQMQSSKYYAVSAQGNGFEGLKSLTIDVTTQGVGCYVKTLLAGVVDNKDIFLDLTLGSVLNQKSITWEKLTGTNAYTTIGSTNISTGLLAYTFTDPNPKKGLNFYRAKLTSADNQIILSNPASATLLQSNQFTLFPNPITTQLNVLTGEQKEFVLNFYNSVGRLSLTKTINGLQNTIPINLMPGAYICAITLNGKVVYTAKVIKVL